MSAAQRQQTIDTIKYFSAPELGDRRDDRMRWTHVLPLENTSPVAVRRGMLRLGRGGEEQMKSNDKQAGIHIGSEKAGK